MFHDNDKTLSFQFLTREDKKSQHSLLNNPCQIQGQTIEMHIHTHSVNLEQWLQNIFDKITITYSLFFTFFSRSESHLGFYRELIF